MLFDVIACGGSPFGYRTLSAPEPDAGTVDGAEVGAAVSVPVNWASWVLVTCVLEEVLTALSS